MAHQQIDSLDLIERCLKNDRTAQFELYQKYAKAMFNVAFRIVKDIHFAEDVMQEAFMKAFKQLDKYNKQASFGSWLKRIVINQSIDFYNKHKRLNFDDYDKNLKIIHNNLEDTTDELNSNDLLSHQAKEILDAIGLLKDSYRMILTLHLIEGYDHEEITQILKINSQQCRTTLSRAKESLRNKIKKYEN